jgi:hypothetical protein
MASNGRSDRSFEIGFVRAVILARCVLSEGLSRGARQARRAGSQSTTTFVSHRRQQDRARVDGVITG